MVHASGGISSPGASLCRSLPCTSNMQKRRVVRARSPKESAKTRPRKDSTATPKCTSPCSVRTLSSKTEVLVCAPGTLCRTCWKMHRQRSHSSGRGVTFHQTQKGLFRLKRQGVTNTSAAISERILLFCDSLARSWRRRSGKAFQVLLFSGECVL